jgi:hypothetical protein
VRNSFIGSSVAMAMGGIFLLGQIRQWPHVNDDELLGGITVILGAFAYRLAKQRRLGLASNAKWKQMMEIALLVLVFVPTVLEATVRDGIVHSPLASVVIPVWSVAAYSVVRFRKAGPSNDSVLSLKR